MYLIVLLAACVAFIIFSSSKWNLHPFMSLLLAAFFFGIFANMSSIEVLGFITEGFGDTIGKIGILIILGIVIGTFLEKSGSAYSLAAFILRIVGKKRIHAANAIIGYIISIPVFGDSAFLILAPLNRALTSKAGISLAGTTAALAMGLTASHTMVPPTPGPIAAAGIIGADLGLVFVFGICVSLFSLVVCIFYSKYIGKKYYISPDIDFPSDDGKTPDKKEPDPEIEEGPSLFKSVVPLALPIVLILLRSVAEYPSHPFGESGVVDFIIFAGNPVVALFLGALFSLLLPKKLTKKMLGTNGWIGDALKNAAVIILITGAGGALGNVLKQSELTELLSNMIGNSGAGIWIPFLLAAALKTAQGSSTVAIITTASILVPLIPVMGFESEVDKAMVVVAIGAGSAVVSHVNDSYFWVVTQLSNFSINEGYKIHTLGTAVLGVSALIFLLLLQLVIQ